MNEAHDRETIHVGQMVGLIEDGASVHTVTDAEVVSIRGGFALVRMYDDTDGLTDRVPISTLYTPKEIARLARREATR